MPNIDVSQPTVQYTDSGAYAHVQFWWRLAATDSATAGLWHKESYSPTQAQLSAHASADILAAAPGYWADAEVRADVVAWVAKEYGLTNITFLEAGAS